MTEPAPHLAALVARLQPFANQIAARFGHPVYLVGSAIEQADARDVDIVCVLPNEEFWGRYGGRAEYDMLTIPWGPGAIRWGNDIAKLSRHAARHLEINVDFKVQASGRVEVSFGDRPRVRLDQLEVEAP